MTKELFIAAIALMLASCSPYQAPETTTIDSSMQEDFTKDVIADYLATHSEEKSPGSLWQTGSKGFFKDNRARQIGDIITVQIGVSITANTTANTSATQTNNSQSGISSLLNLTDNITHAGLVTGAAGLLDSESDRSFKGSGSTDRKDSLNTTIAATVTQVLPNGHMVIRGKREVVINYEKQMLEIAGIVRPEDVSATNTISSDQIAQARVSYGGQGTVNEVQQKKWGIRFLDRWMPF